MFVYEKKLQYPVKIAATNPKLASIIISQYGGPNSNKLQNPEPKPGALSYLSGCRSRQISSPSRAEYGLFFHFELAQTICQRYAFSSQPSRSLSM